MQSRRVHGAVLGQARLRAGVVAMLPGDLSSPRLRLPSAEKLGRVRPRPLRGNVIDPLEWCAKEQHGEPKRLKEREARRTARAVPWLAVEPTGKLAELLRCGVGTDAGARVLLSCVGLPVRGESQREAQDHPEQQLYAQLQETLPAQRHARVNTFECCF